MKAVQDQDLGPDEAVTQAPLAFAWLSEPLSSVLLGRVDQRPPYMARALTAILVYAVTFAVACFATYLKMVAREPIMLLGAGFAITNLVFYTLLRSGWSARLSDPAMSLAQIMAAIFWCGLSYAACPPVRGSLLLLLALLLVFGMFNLRVPQQRLANACALLWMAGIMTVMSSRHPVQFPWHVELVQFLMLATILPVVSVLGAQLTAIRLRLRQQKEELKLALERIRQLATRDELTQLFNRRHMMELLEFHTRQNKRTGAEFCLAVIDLDHFKQINDTFGHSTGDQVLRGFAQHAGVILRESDVMARWGGEEFLILFPDTRIDKAELGVRRLREMIQSLSVTSERPDLRVQFSAGITECLVGESIEAVIDRADQALYAAKAKGRNCTVVR